MPEPVSQSSGVLNEGDTGFHPTGRVLVVKTIIIQSVPIVEGAYPDGWTDEQIIEREVSTVEDLLNLQVDGVIAVSAEIIDGVAVEVSP